MRKDLWAENLIGLAILLGTVALVGIYATRGAPTTTLVDSEWKCEKTEPRTHLVPFVSGKATVLIPTVTRYCVNYVRNK